jgi:hypothetical protein
MESLKACAHSRLNVYRKITNMFCFQVSQQHSHSGPAQHSPARHQSEHGSPFENGGMLQHYMLNSNDLYSISPQQKPKGSRGLDGPSFSPANSLPENGGSFYPAVHSSRSENGVSFHPAMHSSRSESGGLFLTAVHSSRSENGGSFHPAMHSSRSESGGSLYPAVQSSHALVGSSGKGGSLHPQSSLAAQYGRPPEHLGQSLRPPKGHSQHQQTRSARSPQDGGSLDQAPVSFRAQTGALLPHGSGDSFQPSGGPPSSHSWYRSEKHPPESGKPQPQQVAPKGPANPRAAGAKKEGGRRVWLLLGAGLLLAAVAAAVAIVLLVKVRDIWLHVPFFF